MMWFVDIGILNYRQFANRLLFSRDDCWKIFLDEKIKLKSGQVYANSLCKFCAFLDLVLVFFLENKEEIAVRHNRTHPQRRNILINSKLLPAWLPDFFFVRKITRFE